MRGLFTLALLILLALPLYAEELVLEAEAFLGKDAAAYRDDRASNGKCGGVLLEEEGGMRELLTALPELVAGDYEVTLYLRPAPIDVLHHLRVQVQAGDSSLVLGQTQFPPGDAWCEVRIRLVHGGGPMPLTISAGGTSGFDGMRATMSAEEEQTMAAQALSQQNLVEPLKKKDDADIDGFDVLDLLEEEKSIANFKFYDLRVLCDRIVVRPLNQPTALVRQVEVDKIHYRPGETVQATATLMAGDGAYTLVAEVITELDELREVERRQVRLAGPEPQQVTFSYPAGAREFGQALRCTLLRDDVAIHANEALYGVSANVYRIGVTASSGPQDMRAFTMEKARELMRRNKAAYANYFERFAWAPCDYSYLAPENEIFFAGQTQYPGSISGFKNLLDAAHEAGVKGITYGKSCAGGIHGFDTYQRFPEIFHIRPEGIPSEAFNVFYLERMLDGDYLLHAKPIDGGWQHWASLWTNWANPRTVTYGAECIIDSVRMFGWDGIRWDGHFVGAQQPFIDMLDAAVPGFVHGYNIAFANPRGDIFLPPAEHVDDFHTVARNHGLMMDESVRDWSHTNFSTGLIRPFYEALAREADYIKRIGGLPLYITFDLASPQDTTLNVLIGLAAGQRYTYLTSPGDFAYGTLPKFLTRYSAFIWDDTARLAAASEAVNVVVGMGPEGHTPWYDHTTWLRTLPEGRQQVLVNLFNPPQYPAFANRVQAPPPLLKELQVTLRLPPGSRLIRAAQLSPDLAEGHRPLEIRQNGDLAEVLLPTLHTWSIVAFDLADAPRPAYALTTPVEDAAMVLAEQKEAQARIDAEARAKAGIGPSEVPATELPAYKDYARQANRDLEIEASLERPEQIALVRNGILDVHHARGPFSWHNPVESALGIHGGGRFSPSWVDLVGFKLRDAGCMDSFPDTYDELLACDVLVLDNLHASYLGSRRRIMAADFVNAGGGLLVFGGYSNLSMGADHNSSIGELLPVRITRFDCMKRDDAGMTLAVADADFFGDKVEWSRPPVAAAVDTSPLKDGAKVLVTVGGQPAIVASRYGTGRIITVLMNPHGDLPPQAIGYWQWPQWPRLLAACLDWLGEGYLDVSDVRRQLRQVDQEKIQPVELLMSSIDMTSRQFTDNLREAQINVVDQDSARVLLEAIVDNADKIEDIDLLGQLLPTLQSYFDDSFAPLGTKLIKARHPFLRAAGYQILGLAGDSKYAAMLEVGLEDEDPKARREALIGLARSGTPDNMPAIATYLRKGGEEKLLGMTALVSLGQTSALAEALPVYSDTLDRRTRLRSGRRSLHSDLYGGVSFKLTPRQRKMLLNDYRQIQEVEAQVEHDLRFFSESLADPDPEAMAQLETFLQSTTNRKVLPLAYAIYGRLDADAAARFRGAMQTAELQQLRWLSRAPD